MSLFFSTSGAWGSGIGTLTPAQFDQNFWSIYGALNGFNVALTSSVVGIASIDQVSGSNDEFTISLTSGHIDGPFVESYLVFAAKGNWQPNTAYAVGDVVAYNGALYEVIFAHTSHATFSAGANDGQANDFYRLLIAFGGATLPLSGTPGEMLTKLSNADYDTGWSFAVGIPAGGAAGEALFNVTSPAGGAWASPISPVPMKILTVTSAIIGASLSQPINTFFQCIITGGIAVSITDDPTDIVPVGSEFHWLQGSSHPVTFTATGSPLPTLNGIDGFHNETGGVGSVVTLKKIAHNTYDLFGRLA
jgi:hypothetical protein